MPLRRVGIVFSGGLGLAIVLPLLSEAASPILLGAALFVFGASLGSLDVAMNLHAVDVERTSEKPLMSGFHALFSIGAFLGSGFMTALLSRRVSPSMSTILSSIILALLLLFASRACSRTGKKLRNPSSLSPEELSL